MAPFLPIPPLFLPSPHLPLILEVVPLKSRWFIWSSAVNSQRDLGAETQPNYNLVQFSLKMGHLMARILVNVFLY